ncbi:MAG: DUF362 domain-containing protein [Minisyncoccia bacterium]
MNNKEIKNNISIVKTKDHYPDFPFETASHLDQALKNLFLGLGLSKDNPFSEYIKPGETALIKPNWVRDFNPLGYNIDSLISHTSLIKYLMDYLAISMAGRGKIIIGDAPLQNCNFENLKRGNRIEEVVNNFRAKYPNIEVFIEDWRITTMDSSKSSEGGQGVRLQEGEYDKEYKLVDLGKESFLEEISEFSHRFRVTKYKPSLMQKHHKKGKHEYLVSKRIFEADFMINLPKFKTHIKAGLTGALKNLVGINGHKEFLPHHIKGSRERGGDNYKNYSWLREKYEDFYDYVWENLNDFNPITRKIYLKILEFMWLFSDKIGADKISAGGWYGNDTIWRTTLDLNHVAYFYSDKPKKILNIIDGIIAGEGEGPLEPLPKPLGLLIASENPVILDAVMAKVIGYNYEDIPTVFNAIKNTKSRFSFSDLNDMLIPIFEDKKIDVKYSDISSYNFIKPHHWDGKYLE